MSWHVFLLGLTFCGALSAQESSASASITRGTDPGQIIVAEFDNVIVRQRDVDALVAIVFRHGGRSLTKDDERALRQAVLAILRTKVPLQKAIEGLPEALRGRARDASVLDVLAYEVETRLGATVAGVVPVEASLTATGPVVVRLPQPRVSRRINGLSHVLAIGVALQFPNPQAAQSHASQGDVLMDALLGIIHNLDNDAFISPSHPHLKALIENEFSRRCPTLPLGSVLIPELVSQQVSED